MNDPYFDPMAPPKSVTGPLVLPTPKIPRRIGLLCIIFGAALIVTSNLPAGFVYALSPAAKQLMVHAGTRINAQFKADLESRIAKLKAKQEAETIPTVKADLAAQLQRLEAQPKAIPISMGMGFATVGDPRFRVIGALDFLSAIALNFAMIWSGTGLIGQHPWGWRLARRVATLKIARLVLLAVINLGWLLPIQLKAVNAEMAPFLKQNQAAMAGQGMPGGVFNQLISLQTYGGAIAGVIFASAWPVIVLALLSKSGARVACGVAPSGKAAVASL